MDEMRLDFPKLFKHTPHTLQELVISVSLKITSGAWYEGGHFNRSDADSCIVSSALPNLRALHLDFFRFHNGIPRLRLEFSESHVMVYVERG